MKLVRMYTDGSCLGNPGSGGWAVILRLLDSTSKVLAERVLVGHEDNTTNNRMELTAVIKGLEALKEPCLVEVFTDSEYVKLGITQWVYKWAQNGWLTSDRKPVKNIDLWKKLLDISSPLSVPGIHTVSWFWVKGHAGNRDNHRVDSLALDAARGKY